MADIYKKKTTTTNPETGEKVARYSKKWWGRYRDENDRLKRVPLSTNKTAAQKMLNDILHKVERRRAGLEDPIEQASRKSIEDHVLAFEKHLQSKNNTARYVYEVVTKVRRFIDASRCQYVHQIKASDVEGFLVDLRKEHGLSIQTSNHYLKAIKRFVRWLVRSGSLQRNPLDGMETLNADTDRRHNRRSLTADEFVLMYRAAQNGPPSVGLIGPDRAMMYLLAAWTGLRRGEIGSLTLRSFDLQVKSPAVTVAAAYSKHRREDVVVLHPDVVSALQQWLQLRKPEPDEILFAVSERTCGVDRRTSEMLQFDLATARSLWIEEATTKKEGREREKSDFLKYQDSQGRFADFHSLRHTFITNLARANVAPKTAQALARHCDIRLTMDVYTHVEQEEQATAIRGLPSLV